MNVGDRVVVAGPREQTGWVKQIGPAAGKELKPIPASGQLGKRGTVLELTTARQLYGPDATDESMAVVALDGEGKNRAFRSSHLEVL